MGVGSRGHEPRCFGVLWSGVAPECNGCSMSTICEQVRKNGGSKKVKKVLSEMDKFLARLTEAFVIDHEDQEKIEKWTGKTITGVEGFKIIKSKASGRFQVSTAAGTTVYDELKEPAILKKIEGEILENI